VSRKIQIVEVGARDGLQNEKTLLEPHERVELIRRLDSAGAVRQEVVSFVNPKRVPQMAGAEAILAQLGANQGLSRIGVVLNGRGWDRARESGCDEANVVVCATDGFGIRNQGASVEEQVQALANIVEARQTTGGPKITMTVSVAFGCPFDGEVSQDQVVAICRTAATLGVDEIALGDTIGVADPWRVRKMVEAVLSQIGTTPLRLHFHDTRNTGLSNAFAGVEAGVSILDASVGGLGGCPFAPKATGNIGTEDLVYMLERGGFDTGLDMSILLQTADWIAKKLGKAPASSLTRAGPFPAPAAPSSL
jgi:hydroxymethylglutaryl-CoA lyase